MDPELVLLPDAVDIKQEPHDDVKIELSEDEDENVENKDILDIVMNSKYNAVEDDIKIKLEEDPLHIMPKEEDVRATVMNNKCNAVEDRDLKVKVEAEEQILSGDTMLLDQDSALGSLRTGQPEAERLCCVCNKAFRNALALTSHMRTHTSRRPHVCHICKKSFKQRGHLNEHVRTHTGEYSCDICKRSFRRLQLLKLHVPVHAEQEPRTCDICNRSFASDEHLQEHVRMHTSERPYACQRCDKSFKRRHHLRKHSYMSHADQSPYTCKGLNTSEKSQTGLQPYPCKVCPWKSDARS